MLASILAPQQTDSQYVSSLITQLNESNFSDECPRLFQELQKSETIVRKDVLVAVSKIMEFIDNHNLEGAGALLNIFATVRKVFFKPSDLNQLMDKVISSPELSESALVPPLFGLCSRSISSYQDLITIIPDPRLLANFTDQSSSRPVLALLSTTAELDESMRVPLVFGGLFESLLPTAAIDESHSKLIALLLNDKQNRRYFVDMGHVPKLCDIVFGSGISDNTTNALLNLLKLDDLCILKRVQEIITNIGALERFENIARDSSSEEGTALNCLKILNGCISYNPTLASQIRIEIILECAEKYAGIRLTALKVLESACLASPSVNFKDEMIFQRQTLFRDSFFTLFSTFIIFDHSGFSQIDYKNIQCDDEKSLVMQMIVYTQRHQKHPKALNDCRTAIDSELKAIASINALFNFPRDEIDSIRGMLVQNAYSFSKVSQKEWMPRQFVAVCSESFCRSSLGMWLRGERRMLQFESQNVFDTSPSGSSEEHIKAIKAAKNEIDRRDRISKETFALSQAITGANSVLSEVLGRLSIARTEVLENLLKQN